MLSRFRGAPELIGKGTHSNADDEGWNTFVTLILAPDQRLTPAKKSVLEHDYQMDNSHLFIETRAALAQYLLQGLCLY